MTDLVTLSEIKELGNRHGDIFAGALGDTLSDTLGDTFGDKLSDTLGATLGDSLGKTLSVTPELGDTRQQTRWHAN